jgi:hypothetical protein
MDKIYNSKYCASASSTSSSDGDDPAPSTDSIKSSYNFPYFTPNTGTDDNNANSKFRNLFSRDYAADVASINTTTGTGAIRIDVNDTDDSSCVFKVSLADNAFTSLNVTYAATASAL